VKVRSKRFYNTLNSASFNQKETHKGLENTFCYGLIKDAINNLDVFMLHLKTKIEIFRVELRDI
jgi:hypothetical protein